MIYNEEEFDESLDDVITYLKNLENMNNSELLRELQVYKKTLNMLNKKCKSEKLKYLICIIIYRCLNNFANNSYKPIIDKLLEFNKDASYEKAVVDILKQILLFIKSEPTTEEIEYFYITLTAVVSIHNNRFVHFNNTLDSFQANFNGISLSIPIEDENIDIELKSSVEEYIKYFNKKIT